MNNSILVVEYDKQGIPFSVHSVDTKYPDRFITWDFEYCKRMGTLYRRKSGGGLIEGGLYANGPYWANWRRRDIGVREQNDEAKPVPLNRNYPLCRLMEDSVEVDEFAFCPTCGEHMNADNVCDHIAWCPKCSEWVLLTKGGNLKCRHRAEWQ